MDICWNFCQTTGAFIAIIKSEEKDKQNVCLLTRQTRKVEIL